MENGMFKNLIIDVYEKSKENNLLGILYGAVSTYSFKDIDNIQEFVEATNPDMLYLKSKATGVELDVYAWELEFYKIKRSESTIYIKNRNKIEVGIMY